MYTRPRLKKQGDIAPTAPVDHSFYPPFAPPLESSGKVIQRSPQFSKNKHKHFDFSAYANYNENELYNINNASRKYKSDELDFESRRGSDNLHNSPKKRKALRVERFSQERYFDEAGVQIIRFQKGNYKVRGGSPMIRTIPRTKKKPNVRHPVSGKNLDKSVSRSPEYRNRQPKLSLSESMPRFKVDIPRPDVLIPAPMPFELNNPQSNRLVMKGELIDPNSISRFPNPLPHEYQRYVDKFEEYFRYNESHFRFLFKSADLQHCSDGGYFQAVLNGKTRKGKIFGKFMTGDGCMFYGLFNTNQDYEYYRDGYLFLQKFAEGLKIYPHGRKAEYGRFNGETLIQGRRLKL